MADVIPAAMYWIIPFCCLLLLLYPAKVSRQREFQALMAEVESLRRRVDRLEAHLRLPEEDSEKTP